jgi:hypothetical protein
VFTTVRRAMDARRELLLVMAMPGVKRGTSAEARHLRESQPEGTWCVGLPGFEPGTS